MLDPGADHKKTDIVSSTGPFTEPAPVQVIPQANRDYFDLSHQKPWLSRMMLRMMAALARLAPGKMMANVMLTTPEVDRTVMQSPEVQQTFLAMFREALRQGPRGPQYETRLMVTEWDFKPREIQTPVFLWHGEADQNAPIVMDRYMADTIPSCQAKSYPGEGPIPLFKKYAKEIFSTLAG